MSDPVTVALLAVTAGATWKWYKSMQQKDITKLVLSKAKELDMTLEQAALTLGIMRQESSFNATARNPEHGYWERYIRNNPKYINNRWYSQPELWGAWGLGQLLYTTALDLGYPENKCPSDLLIPEVNATLTMLLVKKLWRKYGNPMDVAAAYNSGRPVATAPEVTRNNYVPRVLTNMKAYAPQLAEIAHTYNLG